MNWEHEMYTPTHKETQGESYNNDYSKNISKGHMLVHVAVHWTKIQYSQKTYYNSLDMHPPQDYPHALDLQIGRRSIANLTAESKLAKSQKHIMKIRETEMYMQK